MGRHIDFEAEMPDLERAYNQNIQATRNADGSYSVLSSNGVDVYKVSHNMCTCTGYWRHHHCKHIALVHQLQLKCGDIIICQVCGKFLLVYPPLTADQWEQLHV